MSDQRSDKAIHVTRVEFYGALGLIWLYIALIVGEIERKDGSIMTLILFGAAILMSVTFSLFGFRSFTATKRGKAADSNRSEQ